MSFLLVASVAAIGLGLNPYFVPQAGATAEVGVVSGPLSLSHDTVLAGSTVVMRIEINDPAIADDEANRPDLFLNIPSLAASQEAQRLIPLQLSNGRWVAYLTHLEGDKDTPGTLPNTDLGANDVDPASTVSWERLRGPDTTPTSAVAPACGTK